MREKELGSSSGGLLFSRATACKDVQARSGGAEGGTGIEAFFAFVGVRGRSWVFLGVRERLGRAKRLSDRNVFAAAGPRAPFDWS